MSDVALVLWPTCRVRLSPPTCRTRRRQLSIPLTARLRGVSSTLRDTLMAPLESRTGSGRCYSGRSVLTPSDVPLTQGGGDSSDPRYMHRTAWYRDTANGTMQALDRLPAFSFGGCGIFARKPLIESVEVLRADHAAWNPPALCKMTVADRSKYEPLDQWTYGEPRDHFVSSGSCTALAPGSYEVKVHGTGSGSAIIVVADDGQVQASSPPCKP